MNSRDGKPTDQGRFETTDDVEGHGFRGNRVDADDDVEGHATRVRVGLPQERTEDDVEGHGRRFGIEAEQAADDDVEGHGKFTKF